jgi:hypothetical protein
MDMMEETHPSYDFYRVDFSTADTGHAGVARDRVYVLASHKDRSSCKYDPMSLKAMIADRMREKVQTRPSDYFMAQVVEVQQEALQLAIRRKVEYRPNCRDLSYLLTEREQAALLAYENAYRAEFSVEPSLDPDLVVFLGDDGVKWRTWSAKSHQIPTFRRNAKTGLFWSPFLKRYLVSREKLAALGWPVSEHMAGPMRCKPIPTQDVIRATDLAGNGMHFPCVAIAQMLALCCFGPQEY